MNDAENLIAKDEKGIAVARIHWIHGVKGLFWLVAFVTLGGFLQSLPFLLVDDDGFWRRIFPAIQSVGQLAFWVCLVIGACIFLFYIIMMLVTKVILTSKNLIYKTGWIFTDVKEIDLEEVKGANVDNGLLGSILNYGSIHLDSRFTSDLVLPTIGNPTALVRAINGVRGDIRSDPSHVIIESAPKQSAETPEEVKEEEVTPPPPPVQEPAHPVEQPVPVEPGVPAEPVPAGEGDDPLPKQPTGLTRTALHNAVLDEFSSTTQH